MVEAKGGSWSYSLSGLAYLKVLLHAAKYGSYHRGTVGLLTGVVNKGTVEIENAFPLFHTDPLAPMLEMGCMLVDEILTQEENGHEIVGVYFSNENAKSLVMNVPTQLLANKIRQGLGSNSDAALCLQVLPQFVARPDHSGLQLLTFRSAKGNKASQGQWSPMVSTTPKIENQKETFHQLKTCLVEQQEQKLNDFDDHLNDIKLDFQNKWIHKIV